MVTSVGSAFPAVSSTSTQPSSRKTEQSIAEARRLITQNKIGGGKAMRILNSVSQAEKNVESGKIVDAQRLAREALKLAQNEGDVLPGVDTSDSSETGTEVSPSGGGEGSDETPSGRAQGIDPNEPFQRNTTTYADGSSDSGVSFQYAQPITPAQAPFAVQQHELSHVRRETSDAILNGQRVMVSITIHSQIDSATGERQIGGGNAKIVIFPDIQTSPAQGENLDVLA